MFVASGHELQAGSLRSPTIPASFAARELKARRSDSHPRPRRRSRRAERSTMGPSRAHPPPHHGAGAVPPLPVPSRAWAAFPAVSDGPAIRPRADSARVRPLRESPDADVAKSDGNRVAALQRTAPPRAAIHDSAKHEKPGGLQPGLPCRAIATARAEPRRRVLPVCQPRKFATLLRRRAGVAPPLVPALARRIGGTTPAVRAREVPLRAFPPAVRDNACRSLRIPPCAAAKAVAPSSLFVSLLPA